MIYQTLDKYRPGAAGAVIDEYERAALEFKAVLQRAGEADYTRLADPDTANEDCRSIQTVASHIVYSAYAYANYIRQAVSMKIVSVERRQIAGNEIDGEIDRALIYTAEIFENIWETAEDELFGLPVYPSWGVTYNVDQMLEHAIVHILRHRRQIEKFLLKFEIHRVK